VSAAADCTRAHAASAAAPICGAVSSTDNEPALLQWRPRAPSTSCVVTMPSRRFRAKRAG
jgi:hypothetical protein